MIGGRFKAARDVPSGRLGNAHRDFAMPQGAYRVLQEHHSNGSLADSRSSSTCKLGRNYGIAPRWSRVGDEVVATVPNPMHQHQRRRGATSLGVAMR